jgi:hypothetical protein
MNPSETLSHQRKKIVRFAPARRKPTFDGLIATL